MAKCSSDICGMESNLFCSVCEAETKIDMANACDACAGQGDNPKCMCGGSGKAVDAMIYLREQLVKSLNRNMEIFKVAEALAEELEVRQSSESWDSSDKALKLFKDLKNKIIEGN
jgi:RecJ-like exonuclease